MNPINPSLFMRAAAVAFTVLAILLVSFCAAFMAVVYMHADEKGILPQALSLTDRSSQQVITILPKQQPLPADPASKAPKHQI